MSISVRMGSVLPEQISVARASQPEKQVVLKLKNQHPTTHQSQLSHGAKVINVQKKKLTHNERQ
jgi:hypothetical protein